MIYWNNFTHGFYEILIRTMNDIPKISKNIVSLKYFSFYKFLYV